MIHERMEREIPVNIRKPLADSDETLPSQKTTTRVWWATPKQTCRDELVVYLLFVFFLPQYIHRSAPMY